MENDAYAALPCIYLVTENGLAVLAAVQEGVVALHIQRDGVDVKVVRCPNGHSPQLAWTEDLAEEV